MRTERIVLSIIAILIGLFVAGVVFYFYQIAQTKQDDKTTVTLNPSPSPQEKKSSITITSPENETVVEEKTIDIEGTAPSNSTIVIATENGHSVVTVDASGIFSEEITLDSGTNIMQITSLDQNGKSDSIIYTVSFTTESF